MEKKKENPEEGNHVKSQKETYNSNQGSNQHNQYNNYNQKEMSYKEKRVRSMTKMYYSRQDIQDAIFNFSKDREISPRFYEGFGKRPDNFQFKGDVFEMVKKGATSFHCSEELWKDPLEISTGMTEEQMNELRKGWDFLIDIDSEYLDYSKISAEVLINVLRFHGVKNLNVKFSGSKGFHIIVPWKAFPKEINGQATKDMFPEWPRIISKYLMEKTKKEVAKKINQTFSEGEKYQTAYKYMKGEKREKEIMEQVAPDIVLVAPRHLFRMPYSLHEKTALASVVLNPDEVKNFELPDASPLKIPKGQVKNFCPDAEEGEAKELLVQALDWDKENQTEEQEIPTSESSSSEGQKKGFKPIDISFLKGGSGSSQNVEKFFPPCINLILKGLEDGKKRATFVLINFFRTIGLDKDEVERRVYEWNKKNSQPLKEGYIKSQLSWSYQRKPLLPPNCREYYQNLGVCYPDGICQKIKNPVNYPVLKHKIESQDEEENNKSSKSTKGNKKSTKKKTGKKKSSGKKRDSKNKEENTYKGK